MDYKVRIKNLQEYIKESGLSAFLVLTKINREYLSGFTGSKGLLLVTKNSAKLFVDDRYTIRAKRESDISVKHISALKGNVPIHRPVLSRAEGPINGRATAAVEDTIRLREFQRLKEMGFRVKWKVTSNVVENLRAVKSAKEIAAIKKGSRLIDAAFEHVRKLVKKNLKKGLTEVEVAQELEKFAKKNGADGLAFDPIVAFGKNAAAPHHFSSSQKIGRNNFLLLDFGMKVNGYHTDFTRTLFIGKPNNKQETVYNIVLEAQKKAIKKAEVGTKASVVDRAARDYIDQAGYGEKYTHNGGHGVGLEIHELPNFSPDSKDVLEKDMVVTVEPGIYLEKEFGVRIEDMVIVRKRGPVVLSQISKDLKSMIIN